jgi:Raf kinase inhibitor-like YbhB/YbcL family protein
MLKVREKTVFFVVGCLGTIFALSSVNAENRESPLMKIQSPAFSHNQMIPDSFTCRGVDVNPELLIEGVPARAKTLALIVDDPDAPAGLWSHWIVFDMPVISRIKENSGPPGKLGTTSFGVTGYRGPCPPSGTHRYFFKLYALDIMLGLPTGSDQKSIEKAMEGHCLAKAELIGLCKK